VNSPYCCSSASSERRARIPWARSRNRPAHLYVVSVREQENEIVRAGLQGLRREDGDGGRYFASGRRARPARLRVL
jgi:hypothetical protein